MSTSTGCRIGIRELLLLSEEGEEKGTLFVEKISNPDSL